MRQKAKQILAPLVSLFSLVLGISFFMTYITVWLQAEGSSEWVIGGMHSAFYGGLFLGSFVIERGIRQVGHIRVFAATASLTCVSILAMGLQFDPYLWLGARFLAGFCLAAQYITIESWLLTLSSIYDRGRILAIYMMALYLAQAISQYLINVIPIDGTQGFILSALFVALSIVPITTTRKQQPHMVELSQYTLLGLFRLSPFGFLACLLSGMLLSCVYGFIPAFAVERNLSIATTMSVIIFGGMLLQWPFGKISDVFDRRKILLILAASLFIPSYLIFMSIDPYWIIPLVFLLGGILFTLYPLAISQVCDRVGHEDLTGVTGLLLIVYGVGSTVGPLVAPLFMEYFEIAGLFLYFMVISGILTTIGVIAMIMQRPVAAEEQQEFVPLTHLTPIAYELDPRTEESGE